MTPTLGTSNISRRPVCLSLLLFAAAACGGRAEPQKTSEQALVRADTSHYTVPALPPDSMPTTVWNEITDSRNMVTESSDWPPPFLRNIILVTFGENTPHAEKQRAIDAIAGVVVGGAPIGNGGIYFVRIKDDGTARPLFQAIARLKSFSSVDLATPEMGKPELYGSRSEPKPDPKSHR